MQTNHPTKAGFRQLGQKMGQWSNILFCGHSCNVATDGCESWTLRKNEKTRLDGFEIKGLRKILWVSWTAKKTNEWVLNKAGVKRELLDTVKVRKLAYYDHTMMKQGSCLEKEIMEATMPCTRRRGRPCTAWVDNINTWTGLPVEES